MFVQSLFVRRHEYISICSLNFFVFILLKRALN